VSDRLRAVTEDIDYMPRHLEQMYNVTHTHTHDLVSPCSELTHRLTQSEDSLNLSLVMLSLITNAGVYPSGAYPD